ncbi:MAG: glycosyltransferase [Saccharofermentanales bacterium]
MAFEDSGDNLIRYAFLGGLYPKDMESGIISDSIGAVQNAANLLQWNFVKGIENVLGRPLKLLNCMFIGSFPRRYKKIIVKGGVFCHAPGAEDVNIGFFNLAVVKQFVLPIVIRRALKKSLMSSKKMKKRNSVESEVKQVLFVYSANFCHSIRYIRKLDPQIHICLILPDLPVYMNMSKKGSMLYGIVNRRNKRLLEESLDYTDSFVLLTKAMSDYLHIADRPYTVVEGMVEEENLNQVENGKKLAEETDFLPNLNRDANKKKVVYTGTLTKAYGIMNLVEAFRGIDDEDMRLVICGSGEAREDIIAAAGNDARIVYLGTLEHKEILKIQREATVLVNPRQNSGEYTKYSFPSKIMEYMMSGVPVIGYHLDGIPPEYDEHILYVPPEAEGSVANLRDKITEVCAMSQLEREEIGSKSRLFVLENKNNYAQAGRVMEMVEKVLAGKIPDGKALNEKENGK